MSLHISSWWLATDHHTLLRKAAKTCHRALSRDFGIPCHKIPLERKAISAGNENFSLIKTAIMTQSKMRFFPKMQAVWGRYSLTLCMLRNFACFFGCLWIFFLIKFKKKNLSGISSEHQTVWIQIRPDVLLGLIWIQTVCKSYQQMTNRH